MPLLKLHTQIKADKEIAFNLSRSIDLHKISTIQTNETAIAGTTSGLIGLNESVTWRAKHFGFYQTLTTKITDFEYSNMFVDEMVSGIFKSFRHEHIFEQIEGGTLMTDIFDYESPFGIIGRLVDKIILEKYMINLLNNRNKVIKEYAETEGWKDVLE